MVNFITLQYSSFFWSSGLISEMGNKCSVPTFSNEVNSKTVRTIRHTVLWGAGNRLVQFQGPSGISRSNCLEFFVSSWEWVRTTPTEWKNW